MKCAIIGIGDFGRAAAVGLARAGVEVIAVDWEMDRLNAVKDEVSLAVCFDAAQPHALESHGLDSVDVLVAAIGKNFEAQVLVVVHAKKLGIKRVLARAIIEDHRKVLEAVGADLVFNPEEEAARTLVQRLTIANIKNYFVLAEGFDLMEVLAPPGIVGKTLSALHLRRDHQLNLVAIRRVQRASRGAEPVVEFKPVPSPDDVIQADDVLALVGSVRSIREFVDSHS